MSDTTDFDAFFTMVCEIARKAAAAFYAEYEGVLPTTIAWESNDGEFHLEAIPDELMENREARDQFYGSILPLLLDAIDPARYVMIAEAWCVAGDDGAADVDAWMEHGTSLASHPRRRESLFAVGQERETVMVAEARLRRVGKRRPRVRIDPWRIQVDTRQPGSEASGRLIQPSLPAHGRDPRP